MPSTAKGKSDHCFASTLVEGTGERMLQKLERVLVGAHFFLLGLPAAPSSSQLCPAPFSCWIRQPTCRAHTLPGL